MERLLTEQTKRVEKNEQITEENIICSLKKNARIFKEELDFILRENKQSMIQIRAISDLNMPNMISRLKKFVEGLAQNQLHNFKESSEINDSFSKQYERLNNLEDGLKLHCIECENFGTIRKTFEKIDVATRRIMLLNSDVPPLF
ncbi:MAG: hypothetical protein IK013_01145 [Bacteroidales bacterium]|nr:hypothetical protein [Bacteroidales bacterium]